MRIVEVSSHACHCSICWVCEVLAVFQRPASSWVDFQQCWEVQLELRPFSLSSKSQILRRPNSCQPNTDFSAPANRKSQVELHAAHFQTNPKLRVTSTSRMCHPQCEWLCFRKDTNTSDLLASQMTGELVLVFDCKKCPKPNSDMSMGKEETKTKRFVSRQRQHSIYLN